MNYEPIIRLDKAKRGSAKPVTPHEWPSDIAEALFKAAAEREIARTRLW